MATIPNISKIQRQRGLKSAKALADFAAKLPDDEFKSDVYAVVERARKRYGYTREQKKAEIVRCIRLGARTRFDILNETPFNRNDIQELLNDLASCGQVRVEYIQINVSGPKTAHYFPLETQ